MDVYNLRKIIQDDVLRTDTKTVDLNSVAKAAGVIYPSASAEDLRKILITATQRLGYVPVWL